jgi:hypothetical protein
MRFLKIRLRELSLATAGAVTFSGLMWLLTPAVPVRLGRGLRAA